MGPAHLPWHQQNLWMVALAVVICIAGAMSTSRFFRRLVAVRDPQRYAWLFLTALAGGVTIWCTHFVAMLGYHPGVPVDFEWGMTGLSLVIAIGGSALGLLIAGGNSASRPLTVIGGMLLGSAIVSMHYTGMLALEMHGTMMWDHGLIALSVAFSLVCSVAALLVARSRMRHATDVMATLFALAVVLMHFTGMSAMGVSHSGEMEMSDSDPQYALALAIGVLSLVTISAGLAGYLIDGQSRTAALERFRRLAMYDTLTGLPNRAHLNQRLTEEIRRAEQQGARLGLGVIDIDGFKDVNDKYGHLVGDEMLRVLGARLGQMTSEREDLFIARMGGDEFVMVGVIRDDDTLHTVAADLRAALSGAIQVGRDALVPRASVGVALFPDHAADAEALINNADLAMYRAKDDPGTDVVMYDAAIDGRTRLRRGLVADMRGAIDRGEFFLHYQVQAEVSSGRTIGYEALLRWRHPTLGPVAPAEFIPLAETSGHIVRIGEWVLRTACAQAARWDPPYRLSVNLSAVQLADPGLVETIRQILDETGMPAERLELEVTETAVFSDREQALRALREIKELGVTVALDDFGVGYSSLAALRTFPFDRIKLDRSFITGEDTRQTVTLLETVLSLGRAFGMSVLAEGIETSDQLALLHQAGCDEVQGFLFGRPQPLAEIIGSGALAQGSLVLR